MCVFFIIFKVELVDRSVLPGDVIRWVDKSKGNQKGHVKNVKVATDLLIVGTNQILKDVNAQSLIPLMVWYKNSTTHFGNYHLLYLKGID